MRRRVAGAFHYFWARIGLFKGVNGENYTLARLRCIAPRPGVIRRPFRINLAMEETGMKKAFWPFALTFAVLSAAALAAPTGAVNEDAPKPLPPLQKSFPLDATFSLRDLNGKSVPAELDVSFKLDGAFHASGYSGCNSWSATAYPQQNQHLLLGGLAMTKKTCDKSNLDIERAFLHALMGTPAWDLVNGDLVFKGPGGAMRLVRSL
jgi:heat shock protein HslJ